ncbi:hypothetical protein RRG08_028269 [Elysia crispata]|uniref:C2H2-type domain-containing protein n=1 Tax=Elysia crispata TaxID=231223 RepID=A0AAE1DH48_9GAST|nr:hypothetical protein RRG08_028269 [Elysia crispata]
MAVNLEKHVKADAPFQSEKSKSYILQQCLNVITTFAEFSNLTYRVSRTCKDVEVMTIYRDKLLGVFGPALEPVTLTIDPSGRCLVSILFKPVQRVSLVSGNTEGLDILSLLEVLRMIAGKGFLFCPGIPEKVLVGKVCGKYIECHRAPFKRYQSPQCPVYYKMRTEEQEAGSSTQGMFKMCPQCKQVATIILRLPPASHTVRGGATQSVLGAEKISANSMAQISNAAPGGMNAPAQFKYIVPTPESGHFKLSSAPLLSLPAGVGNSTQSSTSADIERPHTMSNVIVAYPHQQQAEQQGLLDDGSHNLKRSSSESQGQNLSEEAIASLLSARSPTTAETLRNVLLQKRIRLDLSKAQGNEKVTSKQLKNKNKKNMCRICKKIFSSPANLLNHLQRHEGFSGSLPKPLKAKLLSGRQNSSSALMRMVLRGAKTHLSSKKKIAVSETSLRLFMKCLNNLMTSQNSSTSSSARFLRQKTPRNISKNKKLKEKKPEILSEGQKYDTKERPSLSRSSSGLSAMQTLLEAAAIAGINSGNLPSTEDYDAETASYNTSPKLANDSVALESPETKQHRKSPRIASRLKKKELGISTSSSVSPVTSVAWAQPEKLTEPGHLTNLDLLSSVSLDMEKRKPVVSSPSISSPVSLSQPVSFSNSLLKMPSQGNAIDPKFGGPPPLLFAKPGKDGKLPSWVSQSNSVPQLDIMLPQPVTLFSGTVVTETNKAQELTPDCGAMDLTKPKSLSEDTATGLMNILGQSNMVVGEPPKKFQKLLSSGGSHNIPVDVLMHDSIGPRQIPSQSSLPKLPGVVSMNKVSDASLQNRMYASARDYKMDKKLSSLSGRQIQAMIANRGNVSKPGSDEIQCGYKWSGSGGQVKERTQMVRELVPQDVMATYLNKQFLQPPGTRPPGPMLQEVPTYPVLPDPKSPKPLPRLAVGATRAFLPQHLKSLPKFPSPTSPGDEVSCQVALNLTTARQKTKDASPRGKASTRSKRQTRKNNQAAQASVAACISETELPSPTAVSSSMSSAGQSYQLQGSGVTLSCTFSSPSLAAILQNKKEPSPSVAAILQHPTTTSSNSVSVTASIKASAVTAHGLNNDRRPHLNSSDEPLKTGSQNTMKFEPPNISSPDDDECVILSLPIKHERRESQNRERVEREGSASPGNLVVDLQTDSSPAVTSYDHVAVKQERPLT